MMVSPAMMILSAAIFGYFGFTTTFLTTGNNGQFLLFVAIFEWTLRGGCIGFAISALMGFFKPFAGSLLYGIVSLLGALGMAATAVLDLMDSQHMVMPQFLLWLFAAWNGYGAISGLQALAAGKPAQD